MFIKSYIRSSDPLTPVVLVAFRQ